MDVLILSEKASPQITRQHLKKLQDYTRYFSNHFERIHVLSSFDRSRLPEFDFPSNVVFHRMPPWNPSHGYRRGLFHVQYLIRLFLESRKILIRNPQIVAISQNFSHYVLGLVVLLLATRHHRKAIIRISGDPEVGKVILEQRYGLVGSLIARLLPTSEMIVAKRADRIFSSSKLLLEKYPELSDKTTILPDPVPILDDSCAGNVPIKTREYHQGNPVKSIFVGRLEPEKGLIVLLEALALTPTFECNIVGSGSLASQLEDLIIELNLSERVRLCGQKPNREVVKLIGDSDVLILPSFTEYTPAVILEAAALETPAIASRVGGVKYILQHEITGLLFNAGDVHSLRSCLAYFQAHPERWAEWGSQARKLACETFSSSTLLLQSDRAIESLIGEINA